VKGGSIGYLRRYIFLSKVVDTAFHMVTAPAAADTDKMNINITVYTAFTQQLFASVGGKNRCRF
jgi:hypothetical protein